MDPIVFRRLIPEDLEAFIALRIAQLREEGAREEIDLRPALKDYYARHMADGTFAAWVAERGGRIVGTGAVSFVKKPPYFGCPTGRIGLISSMYTAPELRRQGIGKELLSRVIREARDFGCGTVQITASDMGTKLYESCGFEYNRNFMQYRIR